MKKIFLSLTLLAILVAAGCQKGMLEQPKEQNFKTTNANNSIIIENKNQFVSTLKSIPSIQVIKNYTDTTTGITGDFYILKNDNKLIITDKEPNIEKKPWIHIGTLNAYVWVDGGGNPDWSTLSVDCNGVGAINCMSIFGTVISW